MTLRPESAPAPASTPRPRTRPSAAWIRYGTRIAGVLLTIAVVVALVQVGRRDGPAALGAWHAAHVRWGWLALSVACALAGMLVFAAGWRRFLADSGVRVSLWPALRIYLASNLGRYLPGGKAWQMSIVGVMAEAQGLPVAVLTATSLVQGLIGLPLGLILLLATGRGALQVSVFWLAVPVAGMAALLLAPTILRRSGRLREILVTRMPALDSLTTGTMWALAWTGIGSWLGWGVGLWALAHGVLEHPLISLVGGVAAWTGAFLAGLIVFVSPAGLGARDAAMVFMLRAGGMSPGDAIVLALLARVWGTLLEVVPAGAVLLVRRWGAAGAGAVAQPATAEGRPAVDGAVADVNLAD